MAPFSVFLNTLMNRLIRSPLIYDQQIKSVQLKSKSEIKNMPCRLLFRNKTVIKLEIWLLLDFDRNFESQHRANKKLQKLNHLMLFQSVGFFHMKGSRGGMLFCQEGEMFSCCCILHRVLPLVHEHDTRGGVGLQYVNDLLNLPQNHPEFLLPMRQTRFIRITKVCIKLLNQKSPN